MCLFPNHSAARKSNEHHNPLQPEPIESISPFGRRKRDANQVVGNSTKVEDQIAPTTKVNGQSTSRLASQSSGDKPMTSVGSTGRGINSCK